MHKDIEGNSALIYLEKKTVLITMYMHMYRILKIEFIKPFAKQKTIYFHPQKPRNR